MRTQGLPKRWTPSEYGNAVFIDKPIGSPPPTEDEIAELRRSLRYNYERYKEQQLDLPPAAFMVGPTYSIMEHEGGLSCAWQYDDEAPCAYCILNVPRLFVATRYQYGWYASKGYTPKDPL